MLSFGYPLIAFLYLNILLYGVNFPQTLIGKFLRVRWLRFLGLIAYGVYLMHPLVQCLVFNVARGRTLLIDSVVTLALSVLVLAITIFICAISWKFFEKPLVKIGHRVSYSDLRQDSPSAGVREMATGAES